MQSIFELKNKFSYDPDIFDNMKADAVDLLRKAGNAEYTQAIVLFSVSERKYSAIIANACADDKSDELALLERVKVADDSEIRYVLCMWQDNGIDIPSFAFRKMLCDLNPKNSEALLFVTTTEGVSAIKLSQTMK